MTVKGYAAIVTGSLAMVVTALVLWCCTQLPVEEVIVVSLVLYWLVIIATHAMIEWTERRRLRRHAAQIVTLVKEEWEAGRNADMRTDREGAAGAQ